MKTSEAFDKVINSMQSKSNLTDRHILMAFTNLINFMIEYIRENKKLDHFLDVTKKAPLHVSEAFCFYCNLYEEVKKEVEGER